ncbi:ribonuclease D [Rubritalea marina]|uniref:ribonuclease D n=1 Tax=Rubritalea marina TaxID=361055 RepID=UPI00039A7903|nr:ribonuclease D [Rubritalea marina]
MIETSEQLAEFFKVKSTGFHSLDTEADSLHRYHEKMCLLQYSDGERHVLIDPLAVEDMQPLKDLLANNELWMHGADYDITLLRRDLGVVPPVIWDTQIGARLIGVTSFGYGNLVEHFLGVELSKASQKADWSKRPLTEKMSEYAINDVFYLKPLADKIVHGLKELGRYEWFVESCEHARAKVLARPTAKEDPWRIQGAGMLKRKGLLYLRALWYWRDAEASEWDKPTFMVCGNKQLMSWVKQILNGERIELPKHFRSSRRKKFFEAIEEAKKVPAELWPTLPPRPKRRIKDARFDQVCEELCAKRDAVAAELKIDPSIIISKAVIEALAAHEIEPAEALMKWQIELLEL